MDATVYFMLKLAADNTVHHTVNEDSLHLVSIADRQKPWLDAVIGNTKNTVLAAGNTGILLIFNEQYLQSPCTLKIMIKSEQDNTLNIYSSVETKTVSLDAGLHEYEIVFDHPEDAYNFTAGSGEIRLYGFDLFN